jgi:hypothetical protein
MKINDSFIIGVITGSLVFLLLSYLLVHVVGVSNGETKTPGNYTDVGGNIDIEYYLEVSEDSIWVEGVQSKKVYSGKYSDLDSLITADNL